MNALLLTAPEARARGMRPLTHPYKAEEIPMLKRVLRDFEKTPHRPVALVENEPDGSLEVWVEPIPAMAAMALNGGAE